MVNHIFSVTCNSPLDLNVITWLQMVEMIPLYQGITVYTVMTSEFTTRDLRQIMMSRRLRRLFIKISRQSLAPNLSVARVRVWWECCPIWHRILKLYTWVELVVSYLYHLSICCLKPLILFKVTGGWSWSQLTLGDGGVHPGQVTNSSKGWHIGTKNRSCSHSHLRTI